MEGISRESGILPLPINFAHNIYIGWKAAIGTLFLHSDLCAQEARMQMEGPSSSSSQVSKSKILPSFP